MKMRSMDTRRGDLRSRVYDVRQRKKMTQRQVADAAGVSLRTYQAFEKGESVPQQKKLEAILRVLPLDASDLDLEGAREATIESWPPHVQVFLDMMGAMLVAIPNEMEQLSVMHDLTRQMVARRIGQTAPAPTPVE